MKRLTHFFERQNVSVFGSASNQYVIFGISKKDKDINK